jgi:succinoglycan biosynthesis transport protein ExoP
MMMQDIAPLKARRGSARDFLAVIFRRRWIILSIFAVTTVTVLAINLSQAVYYESTGRVQVKRGMRDNIMQGQLRTVTWEEELATEVETVKSGTVIEGAEKRANERRTAEGRPPLKVDQGRVEASVLGESNVLAMSYRDRDPAVAVEVTAALIESYMDYRKDAYTLQYPKEFFDNEMARVSAELEEWTSRRQAFMSATGTVDLGSEGRENLSFLSEQHSQLAATERDIAQIRANLGGMREMLANPTGDADLPFLVNTGFGNDQIITELKKKLVDAQVKVRELEQIYMPQSREMLQAKDQLEGLKGMLASEVKTRIRLLETDLRGHEARRDQVRQSLGEGQGRLATHPAREAKLSEMGTRIAALQKNYQDLAENSEKAKISKATSPDWTVALLQPAGKPYATNQRDYVRLALAPIFSLIVGLGLAFFIDGLDATLKNPREAEEALDLPVLASLNDQKERRA